MTWRKLWPFGRKSETPVIPAQEGPTRGEALRRALARAKEHQVPVYPIQAPVHAAGVVPPGVKAPVTVAMDSWQGSFPAAALIQGDFAGFPGFSYLSMLATRAEYRAMAQALATELTREWIELNSSETSSDSTKQKVTDLTNRLDDMGLKRVIQRAAEHDAYFGRAQIFIDIEGHDRSTPLVLSPRTIAKGSKVRFVPVEAIWTTPAGFNALDPAAKDFYKPLEWFMLGQKVHASRLMTVITRPLPDMLKPAFDFGGMSLSQLAEPYVNNWLRTRQSVADLINNFSITVLSTSMDQALTGGPGEDLFARADLFTELRSNRGLMLVDKEREGIVQVNTPLSGLHELQAQAQEHMCAVSRLPAIILTGISPAGLNASSEGEIRTFYDWIAAQQSAFWFDPIDTALKILQLVEYGEIDEDISWSFVSLFQMTPKEEADIRKSEADSDCAYLDRNVLAPDEVREKLARDPESGYQGLEIERDIDNTPEETKDNETDSK